MKMMRVIGASAIGDADLLEEDAERRLEYQRETHTRQYGNRVNKLSRVQMQRRAKRSRDQRTLRRE